MFRKIITYFLIIAVVLPVLASAVPLPAGGGVNRARAEGATTKEGSGNSSVSSLCSPSVIIDRAAVKYLPFTTSVADYFTGYKRNTEGSVWTCALYTITYLLYEVVMRISIWITGLASDLFNVSIQFSLTGKVFDASENGNIMIKDGWTYVRDLLNLVFIFILLFASISTILQYGNMDIKKILPSLIVAALLVNFSLMIAKMVIDASHIFAWEFYNQIDVENKGGLGNKEIFANMQGSVEMKGNFKKKNLANVFLAGFNPQRLLIESEIVNEEDTKRILPAWKEVYNHAMEKSADITDTLWKMIIIISLESALAIFASFILLAGAIMFVARVAILWIVMIFSPLAFLGMILPRMEKHSQMWWGYLINQSFFAPAFLFMFMLATKFINSKLVDNLLKVNANNDSKIVEGLHMGEIVVIFFNFFVVAFIFSLCLVVARQLGGKTAEFGIGGAHRVKGWALGASGKALKYGWANTRASARYAGGQLADKMLDEEKGWGKSKFAKTLSWMGADSGLRKLGAMKKADEDKKRKEAEKYAGGLSGAGRKNLEREIAGYKTEYGYKEKGMHTATFEGYEKIIEKKKAEEDERERVAINAIELMGSHVADFMDIEGNEEVEVIKQKIKGAKEKAKGILLRGNMEELDKYIEMEDKKVGENDKEKIDENNKEKRKFDNKIKEINDKLTEARKWGSAELADALMKELEETENNAYKNSKKLIEIVARGNRRGNLQKTMDKYEGKRNIISGKPEDKKEEKAKSI